MSHTFLGVARERVYSPGKIDADRGILDAVAAKLAEQHAVRVVSADDELPDPAPGTIVFTMAQGPAALAKMRAWQASGLRVVNTVESILACHRHRMQPALEQHGVRAPDAVLVSTGDGRGLPGWIDSGAWIKRGDVHATREGDVSFVDSRARAEATLAELRRRGLESALAQRHVNGSVIKFYAVRGGFLSWFCNELLHLSGDEENAMRALADHGATALGLEVFGGDVVREEDGTLQLIDLNDWPSYGRCRAAAAEAIAAYLEASASASCL